MQIGTVLGSATATVKHATLRGERLVIVQLERIDGGDDGEPVLAFDRLGSNAGDRVVVTGDGRILQDMLGKDTPGRYSVLALPDT